MFPSSSASSSQKRKYQAAEYHDPDYPADNQGDLDEQPTTSKRAALEQRHNTIATTTTTTTPNATTYQTLQNDAVAVAGSASERLSAVISREFQREETLKHQQLEEIDDRLKQARHLLDRLRYAIVADYYRKQELPLTPADATNLRAGSMLVESEALPQMPLHPSVKKIIGKKPKSYDEILRACPKRAAAQTAEHTIRAKSQVQRRQERRQLQQLIREQGIVIDHEKLAAEQVAVKQEVQASTSEVAALKRLQPPPPLPNATGKALNATRLNNKIKHLVVVGNTSKYIGGGADDGAAGPSSDPQPFHGQTLSHKWLVYVQAKDQATLPLESIVKKVRFFLHTSYRPNDVVDICAPPFQLARRGWGEFPMRIQLFFHEHIQQKPVQLVHQLVLDKTQSGLHTLGAETLVEIWLRSTEEPTKQAPTKVKDETTINSSSRTETTTVNHHQQQQQHEQTIAASPVYTNTASKPRLISYTQNKEELDDNLFEFLNNIGGTQTAFCGDIEKIQPTVIVSEAEVLPHIPTAMAPPLQPLMTNTQTATTTTPPPPINVSPRKLVSPKHVSKVQTMTLATTPAAAAGVAVKQLETTSTTSTVAAKKLETTPTTVAAIGAPKVGVFNVSIPAVAPTTTSNFKSLRIVPNNKNNNNNNNRKTIFLPAGANKSGFIPATTTLTSFVATSPNGLATASQPTPKKILQKKLVQLVDADGKIKYLQMLVATNATPASLTTNTGATMPVAKVISTNANSTISYNSTRLTIKNANLAPNAITKTNSTTSTSPSGIITVAAAAGVTTKPKTSPQIIISAAPAPAAATKEIKTPPTVNVAQQPPSLVSKAAPPPRNVVFQKEGKLYFIDPQQMKLRQQQKKQFSLLKPQVSLLKQQQRPPEKASPLKTTLSSGGGSSVACDHDYAPPLLKSLVMKSTSAPPTSTIFRKPLYVSSSAASTVVNAPTVHLGVRQTRFAASNAFEQLQQQRTTFERQFGNVHFGDMRAAVEYLLRRLPLLLPTAAAKAAFFLPWCNTPKEFNALPALKQRACEWLRAKYISSSLRKHSDLQQLAARTTTGEITANTAFWSTREICTFARCHAYTPAIKELHSSGADKAMQPKADAEPFTALVKSELKQQPHLPLLACDTLTTQTLLHAWTDDMWQRLQQHEVDTNAAQFIDIVGVADTAAAAKLKSGVQNKSTPLHSARNILYLSPPASLTDAAQLVGDICKAQRMNLSPETLADGGTTDRDHDEDDDAPKVEIMQPLAQTMLAQCARMFVEKLLRQALASKVQHSISTVAVTTSAALDSVLGVQDVARVLTQSADFDFLTNCHFGVVAKTGEEQPLALPSKQV